MPFVKEKRRAMQIATLINTHADPELTQDTADSVATWMTDKIMVLVDGAGWHHFANLSFPYPLHKGLTHGRSRSPHRNAMVGIEELYKRHPNMDWYCYFESDCLCVSDKFKEDLRQNRGKFIGGLEYRINGEWSLPLLDQIVDSKVRWSYHLLGAVMFMSKRFVERIVKARIPSRLVAATDKFPSDFFPDFHGYAFEEELFPSLAHYFLPESVFSLGNWSRYNIRWQPEIAPEETTPSASIIHPLKSYDHPVRQHYRRFRERIRKK